jgi:hypothetical protein
MKANRWSKLALAALAAVLMAALAALAAGCGSSTPNSTLSESPDWSYYDNANNELPYFGDPEIKALTADPVYNYSAPAPQAAPEAPPIPAPAANSIFIRVIWGNLIYDPEDPGPARNYSGTMTVDSGAIYILRTVAFEDTDYEISEADSNTVAWHSKIRPAYDGLLIRVDPGTESEADDFLHITIGVYQTEIALADLGANYLSIVPTGDPNGPNDHVALAAHQVNAAGSGFVSGHWRDLDGARRHGGLFKGKWESDEGDLFGHERIRYWPADGFARGKYIDDTGLNKGRLEGTFTVTAETGETGTYAVTWFDRTLTSTLGHVDGVYIQNGDAGYGFSMGNWSAE